MGEKLHLAIAGAALLEYTQGYCCQVFLGNTKQFPLFCNAVFGGGAWVCCPTRISVVTNTEPALVMGFRRQ